MDKDIQNTLLNDLRSASTVDEKVALIILFLEYLAESSVLLDNFNVKSTENNKSTSLAISEILKALGTLVYKSEETVAAITTNGKNISIVTQSVVDLSTSITEIYSHLEIIYKSQEK